MFTEQLQAVATNASVETWQPLLQTWADGLTVIWAGFWQALNKTTAVTASDTPPAFSPLHLPTYPFQRETFALPSNVEKPRSATAEHAPLHPLLQRNVSRFGHKKSLDYYRSF